MTTTITINSLMRFNDKTQTTTDPSPFDFTISSETTSNWAFKRRPFSQTGLTKTADSFDVTVCKVFIPKAFVPELESMLFLQLLISGNQVIDRQIGPRIKEENIFGGFSNNSKFPEGMPNYNNVWTLYPSSPFESNNHWIYESCTHVSINQDWKGRPIQFNIRDTQGYVLTPPMAPANGITGFNLCEFDAVSGITGATGCCPKPCTSTYVEDYKKYKKGRYFSTPPSAVFQPLFQKENQVMAVLNVTYIENDSMSFQDCSLPSNED